MVYIFLKNIDTLWYLSNFFFWNKKNDFTRIIGLFSEKLKFAFSSFF